eukprot:g20362.t2
MRRCLRRRAVARAVGFMGLEARAVQRAWPRGHALQQQPRGNRRADHFIYFNALSSCKRQRDQWPQALSFLLAAACSGITLEKGGYTEAVTMCSRAGVWRKAWEVFDEAVSRGVRPNTILRNSLVATHGEKGGEWLRVRPKPSRFRHAPSRVGLREIQCAMAGQE